MATHFLRKFLKIPQCYAYRQHKIKVPHNLLYTLPQNVILLSIFASKNKERERSFNTVDFHRFLLSQGALRVI